MIPALHARISRRPNSVTDLAISAAHCEGSATSAGTAIERPPAARISAAADSASVAVRELVTTAAPASAMPLAIARPKPRPEPVTTATFPERLNRDRVIFFRTLFSDGNRALHHPRSP